MNAGVSSKAALPGAAPGAGAGTMVGVVREVGMKARTDPAAAPTYYLKLLTDTGAEVRLAGHRLEAAAGRVLAPEAQTPQQQAGATAQVAASSGLPAVSPRLSEYRLLQVKKAANTLAR